MKPFHMHMTRGVPVLLSSQACMYRDLSEARCHVTFLLANHRIFLMSLSEKELNEKISDCSRTCARARMSCSGLCWLSLSAFPSAVWPVLGVTPKKVCLRHYYDTYFNWICYIRATVACKIQGEKYLMYPPPQICCFVLFIYLSGSHIFQMNTRLIIPILNMLWRLHVVFV